MIKLIKNADVYAPRHIGMRDILIEGEKILAVSPHIAGLDDNPYTEIFDLAGARVAPGYIDLHEHITGGGGELGFTSRVPEIKLGEITTAGVTTVLGLLGTDGVTRSIENLLAKCGSLNEEGITAFMLTGAYGYPSPTLSGSVMRDIILFDRIVGVKMAVSDHRSSEMTDDEFLRVCSDARVGGLLSGKAGIAVMHMGSGRDGLGKLFRAIERSDIPLNTFLPTHLGRSERLTLEAAKLTKLGGFADFTASSSPAEKTAAESIMTALDNGAELSRITLSSDGCGSMPKFDAAGNCIGLTYSTPHILHEEILRLINEHKMPLEDAITILTENPAKVLKLEGVKGTISENADADIIVYGPDMSVKDVFARGALMVKDHKAVVNGYFDA